MTRRNEAEGGTNSMRRVSFVVTWVVVTFVLLAGGLTLVAMAGSDLVENVGQVMAIVGGAMLGGPIGKLWDAVQGRGGLGTSATSGLERLREWLTPWAVVAGGVVAYALTAAIGS